MQNKPHHVKTVEEAILQPSALYGFGNALDPSPLHVQKSSGSRLPAKKAFPLSCKQPYFSFVPSHESLCVSSSSSSPSLCNRFGYFPALPRGALPLCFVSLFLDSPSPSSFWSSSGSPTFLHVLLVSTLI